VVARVRVRYAKRGRLRFSSHRDFARAFERALRRAAVPMAYSAGFTPHPKISYVGAAPTGAASEAEYLEIGLAEPVDPLQLHLALDAALPDGLDIVEVVVAGAGSLAERMDASHWRLLVSGPVDAVRDVVGRYLDLGAAVISRMTKSGRKQIDTRVAVVTLRVSAEPADDTRAIMDLVVRQATPAVRPEDVLTAIRDAGGLAPDALGLILATRLAQGPLGADGAVGDPLAADRPQ
jgi:radical SAM-linked protein